MKSIKMILNNYLYFIILFGLFLILLFSILLVLTKGKKKVNIYLKGLLMNLSDYQILALALCIIDTLLFIYALVFKIKLSLALGIVLFLLILIAFIPLKNIKFLLRNVCLNSIGIGILYLANLINNLRLQDNLTSFYLMQIGINILGIFFSLFSFLKYLKNIREIEDLNEKID